MSVTTPACGYHEPPVDCARCGACCREAFDSVPVDAQDHATATRHPELVVTHDDGWRDLERVPSTLIDGRTRCAALLGQGTPGAPFRCTIYEDRPSACRELAVGSANCLLARRRLGWSADPFAAVAVVGARK